MDPRYEDDIDEIVKGMEGEFTARMVVDTLEKMHPNDRHLGKPTTMEITKYLKACPDVEKTARKGSPPTNHYRHDKDWQRTSVEPREEEPRELPSVPIPKEAFERAAAVHDASMDMLDPEHPEMEAMRAEMQERMRVIDECEHTEGWKYQEALEVCPQCGGSRTYKDPHENAVLELVKGITPAGITRLNNVELCNLYNAFMRWSDLVDKSAAGGKKTAEQYAVYAKACAMILTDHAEKQRTNIRKI